MACGCPVVCSNAASLPEVVGDAGVLLTRVEYVKRAGKMWIRVFPDKPFTKKPARPLRPEKENLPSLT
jgi:glycosyltransferase involved in cell wall biosynthesis